MTESKRHRLSKSRFTAGLQCHKLLWLKVHEPDAVELQPNIVLQDRFDQGQQVGELARERFPGAVVIDFPHYEIQQKLAATEQALADGAGVICEASFMADDVFCAVDILEETAGRYRVIEVKSSSSQKHEHVPDAAVQVHVVRACGLDVASAEIMHLSKVCRFPDLGGLFERTDVTDAVESYLPDVPPEIDRQREMLSGPLPDVDIGLHCFEPRECPFLNRCWPADRWHIKKLQGVGPKRVDGFLSTGVCSIADLPPTQKLSFGQRRQIKALQEDRIVVEPTLPQALEPFDCKLGFLDFETIARAVPVWPGMGPWHQAAAQFSYHEDNGDGTYAHYEHLAEGPHDARPPLAERMVEVTQNAEKVVMYTSFERTRIRELRRAVPHLASALKELDDKLIDLYPVVRDCVYHPAFEGSYSLKYVLNPLVPELTYDDLVIVDGMVASVEIARLLFVTGRIPAEQREKTRQDLLAYCKQDTWAMVALLNRLRELAAVF